MKISYNSSKFRININLEQKYEKDKIYILKKEAH